MYILAKEGAYLDPRPEVLGFLSPFEDAANISIEELPERLHELPAKEEILRIADCEPHSSEAKRFLEGGGRKCVIVSVPHVERLCLYRLWQPNPFLREIISEILPGPALDLGCGSGREAVFLASSGFRVLACDRLEDALKKGERLARRYLLPENDRGPIPIEWRQVDLEQDGPPEGIFDLIVSFRYLHRPLLKKVSEWLNPGGSLVLETFTTLHRERYGKPRSDDHVLQPGELPYLAPGLTVRHADEGWRGDVHTGRLWAVK